MAGVDGVSTTQKVRQQKASAVELEWNVLNSSLFVITFLTQQGGKVTCRLCQGTDHRSAECALSPKSTPSPSYHPAGLTDHRPQRESRSWRPTPKGTAFCFSWNAGRCVHDPYC